MFDRIPEREFAMRLYPMMNNAINTLVLRCRNTCENCCATRHITSSTLTDGFSVSVSNAQNNVTEM